MREGKTRRTPKLPAPEKRRPDLVQESRCSRCGNLLGTFDINDSAHFREEVRRGARGPVDRVRLARVHRDYDAHTGEGCPCGATMAYVADSSQPIGRRLVDATRPIVDRVTVGKRGVTIEGRFLDGAKVEWHRAPGLRPWTSEHRTADVTARRAPVDPHTLEEIRGAARVDQRVSLSVPVEPRAGDVVVLTLSNVNGETHQSVRVEPEEVSS